MADDTRVVRIGKNLDINTADSTFMELKQLVDGGARRIICDFSETEYISSVGIGIILSIYKSLQKMEGELIISSLRPKVRAVLETTGLLRILKEI